MSEPGIEDEVARRRAFRDVIEPEIAVMLRVARSLTANSADAEDLVQESLIRAFRAVDRFDGRHPRAWLLTIVRNTNANMHRRQRPKVVDDWDLVHASRPAFGARESPAAEDIYVSEELDEALRAAVANLDPRFRATLVLVDVHDLSYAEAAAVLDVPVGTVMSRLSRARNRVRVALGPNFTTGGETS
ncbi:MAG: RNA polymerase sigma factor [Ornithinimicrobium sp.]|uniref:RNA polymerase sigma factor n=1 Tax=Ornithinimicrobium sp. TaxID=1977084 RepID=UPI0026DF809A|nr:RNA polymerase sigma factor [Ornithinimicrobium sp.]MDO5740208.1 RNA polymerase sigma factor [Ornithinimicrobium sp.]